jgi:protein O-mannosyl-transferase
VFRGNLKLALAGAALAVALSVAYANHFRNSFHFDDFHAAVQNVFVREAGNIPRFFADARLSSTMPDHYNYRPVVYASLAVDYRLGGKLDPLWFHISTFFWFSVQLVLLFLLFRRILETAAPGPSAAWTAMMATAVYGLHPANAETVNYIIQRAEIYATLGIVASLLLFAAVPRARRSHVYLLPAIVAYLSKPPALVFPLLLLAYVVLVEGQRGRDAWRSTWPAFAATAASAVLIVWMTPATFNAGAVSATLYRLTQPWIALYYFKSFFLPTELSADSDRAYVAGAWSTEAVVGYLFLALLAAAAWRSSRSREGRPVAFGIVWFLLALLPTSVMPLAEVANDHRMFFPFAGLALAVFQAARMALSPRAQRAAALATVGVLACFVLGTRARNEVWRTEETLWRDVTEKSPRNGRGWMNYGLQFMAKGDYATALALYDRARTLVPNYYMLAINTGIAHGALRHDDEAVRQFERAIALAPDSSEPRFYYGRWLASIGRTAEAAAQFQAALKLNPLAFDARDALAKIQGS